MPWGLARCPAKTMPCYLPSVDSSHSWERLFLGFPLGNERLLAPVKCFGDSLGLGPQGRWHATQHPTVWEVFHLYLIAPPKYHWSWVSGFAGPDSGPSLSFTLLQCLAIFFSLPLECSDKASLEDTDGASGISLPSIYVSMNCNNKNLSNGTSVQLFIHRR